VSKSLPRVSKLAEPENVAVHVNQIVLPDAFGSGTGSPVSLVAPTVEPTTVPVMPESSCAATKESFVGAASAAPTSRRSSANNRMTGSAENAAPRHAIALPADPSCDPSLDGPERTTGQRALPGTAPVARHMRRHQRARPQRRRSSCRWARSPFDQ
jgi:hypothetical protein